MSQKELEKIIKGIIKTISTVPGLIGLVNKSTTAKNPQKLDSSNYENGIELVKSVKGYAVKLHIISSSNVRTEIVAKELSASVKSYFKNINKKVYNINIYIRGVK